MSCRNVRGVLCNASTAATYSPSKPNQNKLIQQELAGTLLALLLLKPSVPLIVQHRPFPKCCTLAGASAESMGTPRPLMQRIWWPRSPKEVCCPTQPPTTS